MNKMMGDDLEEHTTTEAGCPFYNGGRMMYNYGGSGVYLLLHGAIALSLVLFLLSGARWFWKKTGK